MKEDAHLILFFDWLAWQTIKNPILEVVFHVENERKCTPRQGAYRKRKGVKKGIPDIICPIPRAEYHGLVIELKTETGKLSKDQIRMLKHFHGLGWCARVAKGGQMAIDVFKEYMRL